LKVLEPRVVKLLSKEPRIPSIAVNTPTMAIIPKAMIRMVKNALKRLDFTDFKASEMFSAVVKMELVVTKIK
jgi:hypothetical protein